MKKKLMSIIIVFAITAVAGFNVYSSYNNGKLSALAIANVEALASYENPDFNITCNQSKHTPPGQCWHMYGECMMGAFIRYDDCRFSGYTYDSCVTPCD